MFFAHKKKGKKKREKDDAIYIYIHIYIFLSERDGLSHMRCELIVTDGQDGAVADRTDPNKIVSSTSEQVHDEQIRACTCPSKYVSSKSEHVYEEQGRAGPPRMLSKQTCSQQIRTSERVAPTTY